MEGQGTLHSRRGCVPTGSEPHWTRCPEMLASSDMQGLGQRGRCRWEGKGAGRASGIIADGKARSWVHTLEGAGQPHAGGQLNAAHAAKLPFQSKVLSPRQAIGQPVPASRLGTRHSQPETRALTGHSSPPRGLATPLPQPTHHLKNPLHGGLQNEGASTNLGIFQI